MLKQDLINQLPSISTKRLKLRLFTIDDVNDVYEYASDDSVVKYLTWPKHESLEKTKEILDKHFIDQPGKFAIEFNEHKKCIGCIALHIDYENDKGVFGYVLNKNYWNQGIMTEALKEIIRVNFEVLKLNRIEATHFVGNESSGKVMIKSGMKYEGMCKKELKIKGNYWDVVHYGLIKEEWERN